MYKLEIGLSASVFRMKYHPHADDPAIRHILDQHVVMLSRNIISYYMSRCSSSEEKDALLAYIDNVINGSKPNGCSIENDIRKNAKQSIDDVIILLKAKNIKTLVSSVNEFEESEVQFKKYLTPAAIESESEAYKTSYLYKYTIPLTNYYIQTNSESLPIKRWLKHMFEGERHVEIVDPLIINKRGMLALWNHYLIDVFPNCMSEIDIYTNLSKSERTRQWVIDEFRDNKYHKWNLRVFNCPFNRHERWISTDNMTISIGAGLDFLGNMNTVNECIINISKNRTLTPELSEQIFPESVDN